MRYSSRAFAALLGLLLSLSPVVTTASQRCPTDQLIPGRRARLTPLQFLTAEKEIRAKGAVFKHWDADLNTAVYQTMVEPRKDGSIPLVDPNAKAVFVFFHGSGTASASGKNFTDKMNAILPMGISGVAIDLPFHGENKAGSRAKDMDAFMDYLHQFMQKVKAAARGPNGKKIPIYLAGHSFGPVVAQEYAARYPEDVAGLLLMSPAGSQSEALKWTYDNITTPGEPYMKGPPSIPNDAGGEWAGKVEETATWHTKALPKRIKVKMVLGAEDEWWPGNTELPRRLGKEQKYTMEDGLSLYRGAYPELDLTLIPDTGHMIWEAKGPRGGNLVTEAIEDLTGLAPPGKESALELMSGRQRLQLLWESSPAFQQWMGARFPHALKTEQSAGNYLKQWTIERNKAVGPWLDSLFEVSPEFAQARKYTIGSLRKEIGLDKGRPYEKSQAFVEEYQQYLAMKPEERKAALAKADPFSPPKLEVSPQLTTTTFKDPAKVVANFGQAVTKAQAEAALQGQEATFEAIGPGLFKVTTKFPARTAERLVFADEATAASMGQRAFEQAYANGGYIAPGDQWSAEVDGVIVSGTTTNNRTITKLALKLKE
jgi:pimeloyl-ACP methyl ester carboxylesterase